MNNDEIKSAPPRADELEHTERDRITLELEQGRAELERARERIKAYEENVKKAKRDIYDKYSEIAAISNTAHCGICKFRLDDALTLTFVNEGFQQLLGYSWQELGEKYAYSGAKLLADDELVADLPRFCADTRDSGEAYTGEFWVNAADGTKMWVHASATISIDGGGELYMLCVLQDITNLKNTQLELENALTSLEALTANIPGGIAIFECASGGIALLLANEGFYGLFGFSQKASKEEIFSCISREAREAWYDMARSAMQYRHPFVYELKLNRLDGTSIWCEMTSRPYVMADGAPRIYTMVTDVTARKEMENKLRVRNEQRKLVSNSTDEVFFSYDIESDECIYTGKCGDAIVEDAVASGFLRDRLAQKIIHEDDFALCSRTWKIALTTGDNCHFTLRLKWFDAEYRWHLVYLVPIMGENGRTAQIVGRMVNVDAETKELVRNKAIIEELSSTDQTSGLLNMKAFTERAQAMLLSRGGSVVALAYSDISDFSYINENFGYAAGNEVLRLYGDAIKRLGAQVVGARMHSDYFLTFNSAATQKELVDRLSLAHGEFLEIVKQKYPSCDAHLATGIYFFACDDADINAAIDNANMARKHVKVRRSVPYCVYSDEMRKRRLEEQTIAAKFSFALNNSEFEVFLQPKFALEDMRVVGAEALVRWRNSDGTYLMPDSFISVFERVGYIVELDMCVYEQVLMAMRRWLDEGRRLIPISVNFSRIHANTSNFVERVEKLARKYDIPHNYIEIETTESAMIDDTGKLLEQLAMLKERGFLVDVDDFGTGYSSLNLLMSSPFDIIKADKSILDNIDTDKDRAYILHLVNLIKNADKEIVFEGVETKEQVKLLLEYGCRIGQGWIFDKAIPIDEFEKKYL